MSVRSAAEGPTTGPRTLADQLRGGPDDRLAALLDARPDLAAPAPHDAGQLAARVVVRASVLRALDQLDTLELGVLAAISRGEDAAAVVGPEAAARALTRLLAARGGPTADVSTSAPALSTSSREQSLVDRAAAGAAFELVRRTELLLDRWGTNPPAALRAGGLGVRDLRAAGEL